MFAFIELLLLPVLFLLAVPFGLAMLAFWIWMLVHAIKNKGLSDSERIAWVLVIVLVHFLGAIIYCFVGRPKGNGPISQGVATG